MKALLIEYQKVKKVVLTEKDSISKPLSTFISEHYGISEEDAHNAVVHYNDSIGSKGTFSFMGKSGTFEKIRILTC